MTTTRNLTNRRTLLQSVGLGAMGLATAALLGCTRSNPGGASAPAGATPGASGAAAETTNPKVAGKQRAGGTFTVAATTPNKQHDMHTALGATEWHLISEKALEIHPATGEIVPHMVERYEVADSQGLTLTLKLRNDLRMHNVAPWNGRTFNAEDLAWNLNRIAGNTAEAEKIPKGSFQRASMVANLTKAEAVDPLTVKVTLSKPNSAFFAGLGENRMPLMPKEVVDIGFNDPMKFAGVGPWQMSANVVDQHEDYVRFDKYFRPNEPYFDKVIQRIIPDRASTLASFLSGEIQTLGGPQPSELQTVKKGKPDALYYSWVDTNWEHFRLNNTFKPFADFRVRKALHLAVDYKGMADQFWGDGWSFQAALNPAYPEAWKQDKVRSLAGYNPDTKAADRTTARQMMSAAGFPEGAGLQFEMLYPDLGDIVPLEANALRFQDQMKAVFPQMKVTFKKLDFAAFSVPQAAGQFEATSYVITCTPDAVIEAISQYHSTGSRNYGKFNEPAADALLDKAIVELKRDARKQLLEDFQQQWLDKWQPLLVLHAQPARTFMQSNIGGFDTTAGPWFGYGATTKIGRWFYVDK